MIRQANRNLLFLSLLAASVLVLGACSGGKSAEAPAKTADEAVTRVARGIADGEPQAMWHALPESYQDDVTDLIHTVGRKTDPELWSKTFAVLGKLSRVLSEKRDFILGHPMIAAQMKDRGEAEAGWDAFSEMFETLVKSDLADVDKVKKLDVEEFLADTGARLMRQIAKASAMTSDDKFAKAMQDLAATKATVISSSGDTARVRIEVPGQSPKEDDYVRVEGKWISKAIADGWRAHMDQALAQLDNFAGDEAQNKQMAMMQLAMLEGVLDQILAADTPEQFNASVGSILGMAMGAAMAKTGGTGNPLLGSSGGAAPDPVAPYPNVRTMRSTPLAGLGGEPPDIDVAPVDIDADAEMTFDGLIPLERASEFVGRSVEVVGKNGLDFVGTLLAAEGDTLRFEREYTAGTVSIDMERKDIELLREAR